MNQRIRKRARFNKIYLILLLLFLAACSNEGPTAEIITPTPLPTPVIAEKPEYVVQQGTVVNTLEFTGRVSPVVEEELFFSSDGFVSDVFIRRGDIITEGDVIAQLNIEELESQLTSAQLNLETNEINLSKAILENEDGLLEAELDLREAELALLTAQNNLREAAQDQADQLVDAQNQLALAEISLQTAQNNLNEAGVENSDALVDAQNQLRTSQISLQRAQLNLNGAYQDQEDNQRTSALNLQNAQLSLQTEQNTPASSQLIQAEIDLANAQSRVADAEREYAEVLDREWASEDEINFYKDDLDSAREQLRVSQASYNEALATVNNRPSDLQRLQNDVALQQLALEQANRPIDGSLPLEVQSAQVDLENSQLALERLERGIDPQLALEVQRARLDLEANQTAVARLQRAIDPQLAIEIERAEIQLALSQLNLEKLERGVDPLLELDVEKGKVDVADIERQIEEARLIAPFSGTILRLDVSAGDSVQGFDPVAVAAEPGFLEISAELTAEEFTEMSVGQLAEIRLRNRPEEALDGYVRQLPAGFSGSTVSGDDDDSVRIAFGLGLEIEGETEQAAIPLNLEIGELATVIIVLEEKTNVLYLPPEAIRTFQGRNFVIVRDNDGNQRRVDVRIGIESDDRVEVIAGLEPGWIVVGE